MILPFLLQMLILFVVAAGLILLSYQFIVLPVLRNKQSLVHLQQTAPEEQKILLPLRLQACERLLLFLERIHPNSLLLRMNQPGKTAQDLQSLLIRTVREEFEYNLSQQLYVSQPTWERIRKAKEDTISLVNRAMGNLPDGASSSDLAQAILDLSMQQEQPAVASAISAVKREIPLGNS